MAFNIEVPVHDVCLHSHQEDKEWGEWSESRDICVLGKFKVVDDDDYFDFSVMDEPNWGVPYFVVTVTYSDGDSFGQCTGKKDLVYFTDDGGKANRLKKAIIDNNEKPKNYEGAFEFEGEKIYISWAGYFGCLEGVDIETVFRI